MKHLYLLYMWVLCRGISHAAPTPLFLGTWFACFLVPAIHHSSPGITHPLLIVTRVELDSTVSVTGKQWFIPYATVLYKCHFWDSALMEYFVSCYFCLSPCLFIYMILYFMDSSCFCHLPIVFLLDFTLFFYSALKGNWMLHRPASRGASCASPTNWKGSALYPWPMSVT